MIFPPFFQKLNQSKYCADIGLLDPALFQRCFQFYSTVTEFLFMSLAQKTADEHKMKEFSPEDFDEGMYFFKSSRENLFENFCFLVKIAFPK